MQVWNEINWFPYSLKSIYDFADEIIICEGCHTTWNDSSLRSSDGTIEFIKNFNDKDKKIKNTMYRK